MRIDDRGIGIGYSERWNQPCRHCCRHCKDQTVAAAELNRTGIEHEFRDMIQRKLQSSDSRAESDFGALPAQVGERRVDKSFRKPIARHQWAACRTTLPESFLEGPPVQPRRRPIGT